MRPIIHVENLSKQYSIGARQQHYATIRESIMSAAQSTLRRIRDRGRSLAPTMWALNGVSFDVKPGEAIGVIGRNGAGKSTLLKILSRVVEPTSGAIDLYGRVGSLLEVGAGFHPELSGRENIFLNGVILGMKRSEIARKLDAIVAFSEIDQFLDTPVKHYSSGMYMRLAFAVAAHLEQEILIVDEVLAVGDKSFQQKCLNKMQDIGGNGRTVIFVSHDMGAITRLCGRAIFMDQGAVVDDGPVGPVVSKYLSAGFETTARREWPDPALAPGNEIVRLRSARVCNEQGATVDHVNINARVGVEMTYEILRAQQVLTPNTHFYNEQGVCVFILHDLDPDWRNRPRPPGVYTSTAWIPENFLAEGLLLIGVAVTTYEPMRVHFYERDAIAFQVIDSLDGTTARGDYAGHMPGAVRPLLKWTTRVHRNDE